MALSLRKEHITSEIIATAGACEGMLNQTEPTLQNGCVKVEDIQLNDLNGSNMSIHGDEYFPVVDQNGKENVHFANLPSVRVVFRFLKDFATSIADIKWRWILFMICAWYFGSWVFFALLWKYAAIDDEIRDINIYTTNTCVISTGTFIGYIKQSVELQTTLGGDQYPTEYCHIGWFLMGVQLLANIFVETGILGLAYAKFWRPQTKIPYQRSFSKRATVYLQRKTYCIIFRFFDEEGKYSVLNRVRACFLQDKVTPEGETIPNYQISLKLEPFGVVFQWPVEIVHKIDEKSPLWKYSKADFTNKKFQVLVELVGDSLITGETSQSYVSYVNCDIHWGGYFKPCIEFDEFSQSYVIRHKNIDELCESTMPECSAEEFSRTLSHRNYLSL